MVPEVSGSRDAWERLYSKKGLQYGGTGELSMVEPFLRSGMLVLDAGCGEGKTAEALSRKADVIGCDFSREALRTLRSQRDPERSINLVECNILSLPIGSEKVDMVVAVHALSHMRERERAQAAHELARVLRRGGTIFVEGFGRGDIRYGSGDEIEDATFLRGNGIITHYFREGEVPALFGRFEPVSEIGSVRRVSFGPVAGRRDLIRVLLRKP